MDQAELARQRDATLPPRWIEEALQDLPGDAALAAAERRKHIVWLLERPSLSKNALCGLYLTEQLVTWLPSEDRQPLVDLASGDGYLIRQGTEMTRRQGRDYLACCWQQLSGATREVPSP